MKVHIYEYSEKRLRLSILDTAGNRTNACVSEVIFQFTRVKYKITY